MDQLLPNLWFDILVSSIVNQTFSPCCIENFLLRLVTLFYTPISMLPPKEFFQAVLCDIGLCISFTFRFLFL